MSDIQIHAILLSLKAAFVDGSWFTICPIGDACKVVGIQDYMQHPHWPVLNAMHCKRWEDIGPEHKRTLVRMTGEILGITPDAQLLLGA